MRDERNNLKSYLILVVQFLSVSPHVGSSQYLYYVLIDCDYHYQCYHFLVIHVLLKTKETFKFFPMNSVELLYGVE